MTPVVVVAPEVSSALAAGEPVVALETTLVAHGFPPPEGAAVGLECERRIRSAGATPATVGVLDGAIRVGLRPDELERFGSSADARKAGPRELAASAVDGSVGATTVAGTLAVCRVVGIRFVASGGIGGVHRGFSKTLDISADPGELARTQALVVSSGAKSILDVPATAELLETLGIPVLGFRTNEIPLFYRAGGGPPVSARVETADEAATIARLHWELGRGGLLLARPPDESLDVEPLVEEGVREAERRGVRGQGTTPFLLSYLHEATGGRTVEVNRRLVADNAMLAAQVAAAYARGSTHAPLR